jgi:hypothetical protein
MKIIFKITNTLLDEVRDDLVRTHEFAAERVGFFVCRVASLPSGGAVILVHDYKPVEDADYVDDPTVGAMMGPGAIRKALEFALNNKSGMFHVHMHEHLDRPRFSRVDTRESAKFVPDFWNVRPEMPHGAVVLSKDSACGFCWIPGVSKPAEITDVKFIGSPMSSIRVWP